MCANILKQKSQQSIIELSSPVVTSDTLRLLSSETNRYRDRNISIKIVGFGEIITSHVIQQIINEKIH